MINIYWPVYKGLEHQFSELMTNIHIDDNQLNVYSLKISELILRAAVEIESISKDLYSINQGTKTSHIKYDEVAIKHLNQLWNLEKKVIIVSSPNCFQTNRLIYPFIKNEFRTGGQKMTFGWNNAYQNIKHDRANSLKFGNIKYLFDIMAALFTLNVYYKDEVFELGTDTKGTAFPINLGSEIFSINLHKRGVYDGTGKYSNQDDLDKSIYVNVMTEESQKKLDKANIEFQQKQMKLLLNHPKYLKYISEKDGSKFSGGNFAFDVFGFEEYKILIQQALQTFSKYFNFEQATHEAILNKNIVIAIGKNRP